MTNWDKTIKTKVNTALRLSELLGLNVRYNSSENLYFIRKHKECIIVPAGKDQEAVLRYLKEHHPEVTL